MHRRPAARHVTIGRAVLFRGRLVGPFAAIVVSLVLSGAAGGAPARSSAALVRVQLVGTIEVNANISKGDSSLTYSGRAQFDVTLSSDELATVPLTNEWTATWGSCLWERQTSDGEMRITLHGLRSGHPVLEISGTAAPATVACNNTTVSAAPGWHLVDNDGGGPIVPEFGWADYGSDPGTGTLSLACADCQPAGSYRVRAVWHRSVNFSPPRPRPGQVIRMSEGVVLLEKSSVDTFWSPVTSANVRVKCAMRYTPSTGRAKWVIGRGFWRTPGQRGGESEGQVKCGPWRIPKSARRPYVFVKPKVTYRGKTLSRPVIQLLLR